MNLQEAIINELLKEDNKNGTFIDTDVVCKELVKINNIVRAEYKEDSSLYILYLSKYFKRLANQYSISFSVNYKRVETGRAVDAVFDKYYGENNYSIEYGNDYNGEWWVYIRDKYGRFNRMTTIGLPSSF